MSIDINKLEESEILALAKQQIRAKAKQKEQWQRRNAKLMLFKQKAEAAGIKVTEEEIDEYLKG